jgi:hypothetical protein
MPGSGTSVFSEAEDFEAALRAENCLGLLVTGTGQFRARLLGSPCTVCGSPRPTSSCRASLLPPPADMMLVSLPRSTRSAAKWGGITIGGREIVTLGAGGH